MSELMMKFDSICATNGDDTAFFYRQMNSSSSITSTGGHADHRQGGNCHSEKKDHSNKLHTVGFSELNSNINLIASELHNRHSLRSAFTSSNRPASMSTSASCIPTEELIALAGSRCVSNLPSPGEAAAVMACARLHITFVPIALDGPHRTNDSRVKTILKETKPIAAIAVLPLPDYVYGADGQAVSGDDDDWETKPALSSSEVDVDYHPTILRLNRLGINRIITVKGQDGTVIGPMAGIADKDLKVQSEDMVEDGRDPMYILYTSGSTSKPKAVIQTYSGLWNRICWQWKTFPFVQQMRRDIGLKETRNLLRKDDILCDGDIEKMQEINDIVLRRTSLSFVDSMAEIFGTLLGGASLFCHLYVEGNEMIRPGLGIGDMLDVASRDGLRITRMTCLPSQLSQAFRYRKAKDVNNLEQNHHEWTETLDLVIVSGEPCPRALPSLCRVFLCQGTQGGQVLPWL